ncbi:MAG TPA: hypothetical protein VIS06_11250, partial [Mycobacteriales bacterium]
MNSTAAPQWHSGTETTTPTRHRPDGVRWADGIPQPDLSPAQTRALSAAHEAGHAVIGQVRGLSLAYIALKGALGCPADTGGYTAWQA